MKEHEAERALRAAQEQEIDLARIVVHPDVQVRECLDEDLVDQYVEVIDDVPPVVLFDTGLERDLVELADGIHRLEAAERAGRATIRALVITGTHDDVLDYADSANAKHGKPLTWEERQYATKRMYERHFHRYPPEEQGRGPHAGWWDEGWSVERVAREMGYAVQTVKNVVGVGEGRVPRKYSNPQPDPPAPSVQSIVQAAPEEYRADLGKTAREQHWSPQEAQVAVEGLQDPALPEDVKEQMAQGLFPPVHQGASGQYEMSKHTIERQAQALLQEDVQYHLSRMLGVCMDVQRHFTPQEMVAQLPVDERQRLLAPYSSLHVAKDYLVALHAALQGTGLHVVVGEEVKDGGE